MMNSQEEKKIQKTIRWLQKQAAGRLCKLTLLLEEVFEDVPITVHYRIKSKDSILKKCNRKNLPPEALTDILGLRLIGRTENFASILRKVFDNFKVKEIEDFWFHTTELGYRSFHVLIDAWGFTVELQIHTAVSSAFALLCHDVYKDHGDNKIVRDAVRLLRRTLEGEAQGVNCDHMTLVNCNNCGTKKEVAIGLS